MTSSASSTKPVFLVMNQKSNIRAARWGDGNFLRKTWINVLRKKTTRQNEDQLDSFIGLKNIAKLKQIKSSNKAIPTT